MEAAIVYGRKNENLEVVGGETTHRKNMRKKERISEPNGFKKWR